MKKVCALKFLCVTLTMIMVLSTGISAMAAVSATGEVTYSLGENAAYEVKVDVTGAEPTEMVTFLVHDAEDLYSIDSSNIKFVAQDQGNVQFTYSGTGEWTTDYKIYVGGESRSSGLAVDAEETQEVKATVKVDGALSETATIAAKGATLFEISGIGTSNVTGVKVDDAAADFYKAGDKVIVNAALTAESIVEITTGGTPAGKLSVRLGTVKVSANQLIAFGRVSDTSFTECGIIVGEEQYKALAVAGNSGKTKGGFAVALEDDSEEADLVSEFGNTQVKAYITNGSDTAYSIAVKPATVQ